MNRKFKTLKNEYKDNFIDALSYHLKQKQIDEMNEYTKEFDRSQFVEMLVSQKEEIAMLKSQLKQREDIIKALNEIQEYIKNKKIGEEFFGNEPYMFETKYGKDILQIMEKYKGDSNE